MTMTKPTSEQVTFIQTGGGAVQRTVLDKLRDSVSIKDFGATGDGITDDTAAINAAIAYASKATTNPTYGNEIVVTWPSGIYCVSSIDLTNRRNVWFYTAGYVQIKGIDSSSKNFIFGSTNFNSSNPPASQVTTGCYVGGPGYWEIYAGSGTSYVYGMRLEHFTESHFERISSGSGYVPMPSGDICGMYLQYTYNNVFIDIGFPVPAAPPAGKKSYGLFMGNNNVNANTFIACRTQAANVVSAPYTDTVGVRLDGSNNVLDTCDLSALEIAIEETGRGNAIRNSYCEYVNVFVSGPVAGQSKGCVVSGGIIEIANSGTAFQLRNTENFTIVGGHYKGALSGTRTFIDQPSGTLYGISVINPNIESGHFANLVTGLYRNPSGLSDAAILQPAWVTFPDTQVPSSNANTLDDYEEGTFDFSVQFGGASTGITYTYRAGSYTKIGNMVSVRGTIALSSKGSATGNARISGLPFAVFNSTAAAASPELFVQNMTFADIVQGYGTLNGTTVELYECTNAGAVTPITDADFANDSIIVIQYTYRTQT